MYLQHTESIIKTMGDRDPGCKVQVQKFTSDDRETCKRESTS